MTHITSFDQLDALLSPLHDCLFDLDRAIFDVATHQWHGTFLRPKWDSPLAVHRRRAFIITEIRLPVAEVTLSFRGVAQVRIRKDQRIGNYLFDETRPLPSGVRLLFIQALEVDLVLDTSIDATYQEHPLPGHTAVYRSVGIVQTGPRIEADVSGT